jgi:hypothetical protein
VLSRNRNAALEGFTSALLLSVADFAEAAVKRWSLFAEQDPVFALGPA